MKKFLLWMLPLGFLGVVAGGLVLLVLSGRAGMAIPEKIAAAVRGTLQKPLALLREAKFFLFGCEDPHMGKPEYYDELY